MGFFEATYPSNTLKTLKYMSLITVIPLTNSNLLEFKGYALLHLCITGLLANVSHNKPEIN